jgi:hypothetical protein
MIIIDMKAKMFNEEGSLMRFAEDMGNTNVSPTIIDAK